MNNNQRAFFLVAPLVFLGVIVLLLSDFGQHSSLAYQQASPKTSKTPNHALAQNTRAAPNTRAPVTGNQKIKETYTVISIGDEIKVVTKSEVKNEQKRIEDEYKQDMKLYQDSKKIKNKKDAATDKPPVKKTIKILKSNIKTLEEAEKFRDDKIKEREKAGSKKTTSDNKW
jgi:hypothetical protein